MRKMLRWGLQLARDSLVTLLGWGLIVVAVPVVIGYGVVRIGYFMGQSFILKLRIKSRCR